MSDNAQVGERNIAASRRFATVTAVFTIIVVLGTATAGLVGPRFNRISRDVRLASLANDLQTIRQQLAYYRVQHRDAYPKLAELEAQLTAKTDADGAEGGELGPYLKRIPANPFSHQATVGAGEVGSSGWFYDEATGEFRANDTPEHTSY